MPPTIWSSEEIEILRNNWSSKTKPELLVLLSPKKWSSIRHKACELSLKKERHRVRYWHTYWGCPDIHLTDVERGYFAGIIDGEGHIRIVRSKQKGGDYYAPLIGITNTDKSLIDKCMQIFKSGRFYMKRQKDLKHKLTYVYVIASVKGVKQILTQIVDVLTVKKQRAELVLEFIKVKETKIAFGIHPREIELYEKVRHLNERLGNGKVNV